MSLARRISELLSTNRHFDAAIFVELGNNGVKTQEIRHLKPSYSKAFKIQVMSKLTVDSQ